MPPASLTAEDAIAALKGKIDRLGPVNMMAIEQFDELETRHMFLTTQRKDLVDSIAQTSEAIKRIDETTRQRFTRSVRRDQPQLPGDVQHAVRRRPRRPDAARRERSARERHRDHRAAARASGCRACSCCRAARRR